jgi:hypothetical protein
MYGDRLDYLAILQAKILHHKFARQTKQLWLEIIVFHADFTSQKMASVKARQSSQLTHIATVN